MRWELFLAFLSAALIVQVVPGPEMLLGLAESAHEPMSVRRVFVRAWLNNLANPKVILFYLAFLPQFVAPTAGSPTLQLLMLGFVFLLLGLVIDLALGFFSGHIGAWLRRRPSFRKGIDRLAGTIMGALGVRLLISGRHS